MTRFIRVPDEILSAAHDRSKAREAGDWAEADRLRTLIEDAGWRVVDRGVDFRLEPAVPPDLDADGTTIHGSSASVPSRLDQPPDRAATIVLLADASTDLDAVRVAVGGGAAGAAAPPQVVVVSVEPLDPRAGDEIEVLRMASTAGPGTRLNAGIRRATGTILILLDGTVTVLGDIVAPLAKALDDPTVAVAGGWGSRTDDLRTFVPSRSEADVIDLGCLAMRRADALKIGPLDERFVDPSRLGAWLSLGLRYGATAPAVDHVPAPLAGRVVDLPATRATPGEAGGKAARRDFYRLLDAFGPVIAKNGQGRA